MFSKYLCVLIELSNKKYRVHVALPRDLHVIYNFQLDWSSSAYSFLQCVYWAHGCPFLKVDATPLMLSGIAPCMITSLQDIKTSSKMVYPIVSPLASYEWRVNRNTSHMSLVLDCRRSYNTRKMKELLNLESDQ